MPVDSKLEVAQRLSNRLLPEALDQYVHSLTDLMSSDMVNRINTTIDRPLEIAYDQRVGKDYLLCEYNRDGDSYRSCWSNTYEPDYLPDAIFPSDYLRALEIHANKAFEAYKNLYFRGGVSSVYLWESVPNQALQSFNAAILFKKDIENVIGYQASWDSVHTVSINNQNDKRANYKAISSSILWLRIGNTLQMVGTIIKRMNIDASLTNGPSSHVANIGQIVEDIENKMRGNIESLYFSKINEILNKLRRLPLNPIRRDNFRASLNFKEHIENYLSRRSVHKT